MPKRITCKEQLALAKRINRKLEKLGHINPEVYVEQRINSKGKFSLFSSVVDYKDGTCRCLFVVNVHGQDKTLGDLAKAFWEKYLTVLK